ncbi:MAG: hypothetical protein Q7U08_03995 [Flavobacteriaceae bacterium]|nr:hypothetical protein [Flavobacteriaceae bacterium]
MKKSAFKIAAVMLLLTISCSKDNLIDTEQTPFSVDENNQIVNGERKSGNESMGSGTIMSFISTSIDNKVYIKACLPTGRNLLQQGNFSGSLAGVGKINSNLSTYKFISCEEAPINPPNSGEPLMYKLRAEGKILISTRDYCSITLTGNLYPWYYTNYGFDGGTFIGLATMQSGEGKLKVLNNKNFNVYKQEISYADPGINLATGKIRLHFSDF